MDYLNENSVKFIDYKDTDTLKNFLDNQGRIVSQRYSKLSRKRQSEVEEAIKRARFMALLPYIAS